MTVYNSNSAAVAAQQQQQQQQAAAAQAAAQQQHQQQQQRQQHQQRLGELLEAVKQEFDYAYNESSSFKQVKEDYDMKYNQQTSEMQQIRQTVYELEMAHRKIKEAYEEEILRLKTELENRDRQAQIHQQQAAQVAAQQQQQPHLHHQPPHPHAHHQPPHKDQVHYGGYQPPLNPTLPPTIKQSPQQPDVKPLLNSPKPNTPIQAKQEVASPSPIPPSAAAAATAAASAAAGSNFANGEDKEETALETSTALTIVDKSQHIVNPAQKALHVKEIPPFLSDLEVSKANPEFKKQKLDYYVLYNPAFERDLDVEMIHSLDHSSVVCCVRFSKDGKFIATGCNKTTQVFNVETGELVAKLIDDNNSTDAAAKVNGETKNGGAATPATGEVGEPAAATAAAASDNGDLYIRSVCFSPDGKLLATGAEDKLIRIWDLTTKRIIKILRGHEQDIYSLDFFPDGNRLVSGSGDRTVRIWDLRSSQCSLTLSIEDGVTTVAVSPDGNLIAAGSLDRTVRVWDSTTGFLVERLDSGNENGNGHEDSVYSVAFSINGKQIASGSLDRTVKLWNLEGKQEPQTIATGKKSSCEVTYIGHKDFVLSVCSTPKNEYILSGSKDRGVIFWDQLSGNPLLMLQGHRNSVISVAVSLNSQGSEGIFATGSGDCKARLWRWTKKNV